MTYFEKVKNIITEATSNKELDGAKEYMYIHGLLMEMNQTERDCIRGLIDEQRLKLNEQVSEFGYSEHVKKLQTELNQNGFSCGQDQTGVFSAGTFNALQTALNTYKQLKQNAQLNENSMEEIAWMSLPKHKNINEADPQEWADWAVRNPNDAVTIVNGWLQNSNNNEDILYKISQCILAIPSDIAMYRTTRAQLCQLYNNYINANFPEGNEVKTGVKMTQDQTQQQNKQGYGPTKIKTFEMGGIAKNNYIKTFQNELKQTNDFVISTLDGTFDQETLTACEQLLYKIQQLKAQQA